MVRNSSYAQRALSNGANAFWTPSPSRFGVEGDWFTGVIQSMACQAIVRADRAIHGEGQA